MRYSEKSADTLLVSDVLFSEILLQAFLFRADLKGQKDDFSGKMSIFEAWNTCQSNDTTSSRPS